MAWNSLKSLLEEELPLSRSAASLKLRVLLLPAHASHYAKSSRNSKQGKPQTASGKDF